MKRSTQWIVVAATLILSAACGGDRPGRTSEVPALIVQLTLDQFAGGIIPRMDSMFTGGFRRVLDDGFYYDQGRVAHGFTASHPGHGSLATGAYPASHGLVANEIWVLKDNGEWNWVEIVADSNEHIVGFPDREGPSPRAMSVPTLGTWIKWHDPEARAITISNSSFAAVTQAGWASDGAYWLDGATGMMVTSSYYTDRYPPWVEAFNQEVMPGYRLLDSWDLQVPPAFRDLARPDSADFENGGGASSVFPHRVDLTALDDPGNGLQEQEIRSAFLQGTPASDQAVLRFAMEAVRAEQLGQRGSTDYLNIGLGSTDGVGHRYGPLSLEQLDVFFRLDRDLGTFFEQLDEVVGAGRWLVAISGDHGAPEAVEYRLEQGLPARRVSLAEIDSLLDEIETIAERHDGSEAELVTLIEDRLERADFVAEALTQDELMGRTATSFEQIDEMKKSFRPGLTPDFPMWGSGRRDHHPARYGIWVVFNQYTMFYAAASVHGSPYQYDRWVPIVFYGTGVPPGRSHRTAHTVDLAPTLSRLARVPIPWTVDGAVLLEIVPGSR